MNAHESSTEPRLTSLAHGGGCGCKIAPGVLTEILKSASRLPVPPELLVWPSTNTPAANTVVLLAMPPELIFSLPPDDTIVADVVPPEETYSWPPAKTVSLTVTPPGETISPDGSKPRRFR